jgi:5-hydroxyisourate hydrolase
MSKITTHVLDSVLGKPAGGIAVKLERKEDHGWSAITQTETDRDGRCASLALEAEPGIYRLIFATDEYLSRQGRTTVYPEIAITFRCGNDAHYHIPLLLSDNSYTTYRGS